MKARECEDGSVDESAPGGWRRVSHRLWAATTERELRDHLSGSDWSLLVKAAFFAILGPIAVSGSWMTGQADGKLDVELLLAAIAAWLTGWFVITERKQPPT
jgi:hypothetical protein